MIINTRPHKQARKLSYKLEALNIEHTSFPLSDIKQRKNLTSADIEILKDIHTFDGIAFTSAAAVKYGIKIVQDFISLEECNAKFLAVGPSTQENLSNHGLNSLIPKEFQSEGLGLLMQDEGLKKVIIFSNSWSEKSISSNEETEVVYIASHDLEINHEMVMNLQKELELSENIVFIYSTNIFDALTADLSKKALSSTTWIIPSTRIANHVSKVSGKIVQASSAIDEDMIDACIKIN